MQPIGILAYLFHPLSVLHQRLLEFQELMELEDGYPLEHARILDNAQNLLLLLMMNMSLMDQNVWLMEQHLQDINSMQQQLKRWYLLLECHSLYLKLKDCSDEQKGNLYLSQEYHAQLMEPNIFHYHHQKLVLQAVRNLFLPQYTPQLNPIEKNWQSLKNSFTRKVYWGCQNRIIKSQIRWSYQQCLISLFLSQWKQISIWVQ
ncbi:unnamed protein product [Paramecium pentaurelia]|uniref:Tc1-like transposase DDE domain-containing protein n=1 Tax=Paramecium pentaurelia TaxID=43138 RepID=A0A8S1WP26_9CILI|nr:unnamed protein product [Paramecium pentaurelia]